MPTTPVSREYLREPSGADVHCPDVTSNDQPRSADDETRIIDFVTLGSQPLPLTVAVTAQVPALLGAFSTAVALPATPAFTV